MTTMLTMLIIGAAAWYGLPRIMRLASERRMRAACAASGALVLTYDDGPHPDCTPAVLDALAEAGAKATFFIRGDNARRYPALVERIVSEGHCIGAHTYEHRNAWRSLPGQTPHDINRGYEAIDRWAPRNAPFRPPYGKLTLDGWLAIARRGAKTIYWTEDSRDSWATPRDAETTSDRVEAAGGGIVLMHDHHESPARRAIALKLTTRLLDAAKRRGWSVMTADALAASMRNEAA